LNQRGGREKRVVSLEERDPILAQQEAAVEIYKHLDYQIYRK
jgi:hypothetical protein